MTRVLIVLGLLLVIAGGGVSALSESGSADTAPSVEDAAGADTIPTEAPATATPEPVTNREDCDAIRGNDYLSPEERTWFLANCVTR